MPKHSYYSLPITAIVFIGLIACSSCRNRYPIDVCPCLEIEISNVYDVFLVDKKRSVPLVVLAPSVKLVKKLSPDSVVLSNLKSQELIQNPNSPGHRYWEPFGIPNICVEGYFLHQCGKDPLLVPLGMDREKAIQLAAELIAEAKKDQSVPEEGDTNIKEE